MRLVWADTDPRPLLFYFEVLSLTRHDVSLSVWADQGRFPPADVEDFLFASNSSTTWPPQSPAALPRWRPPGTSSATRPPTTRPAWSRGATCPSRPKAPAGHDWLSST